MGNETLNQENINKLSEKIVLKPELSFARKIVLELQSIDIDDQETIKTMNSLLSTALEEEDDKKFNDILTEIITKINNQKSSIQSLNYGTRQKIETYEIDNINTLLLYFGVKKEKIKEIQDRFVELGLDLFPMLVKFRSYIDNDLSGLDQKIKNKIIKSIGIKLSNITEKLDELKEEEIDRYGNLDNFKNNRWIVNNMITGLFEKTTNQVLPSALLLAKKIDIDRLTTKQKEKYTKLQEMFNSELTSDGDFDKKFFSKVGAGEVWDSSRNNWETFDSNDEEDKGILSENGFNNNKFLELNLLNKEDQKIEKASTMGYWAGIAVLLGNDAASFTGFWTIPGAVIGGGYSLVDTISQDDFMVTILKQVGIIPEEFRISKDWEDRVLASIGIIPGVKAISKSSKLIKYISKLKGADLTIFNNMVGSIGNKLKSITKLSNLKKVDFDTEVLSVANELKRLRDIHANKGLPGGSYFSYNDRYTKLYENLDNKGITGVAGRDAERIAEIKNLDRLIAEEIIDLRLIEKGDFSRVLSKIEGLKDGETIKVGELEFKKENGRYKYVFDPKKSYDADWDYIKKLLKYDYKRKKIIKNYMSKNPIIDSHTVTVDNKGEYVIFDSLRNLLFGDERAKFIKKNSKKIFKEFNGVTLDQFIINYKKTILQNFKQNGIKTIGDYISKAGYNVVENSKGEAKRSEFWAGLDGDGLKQKADVIGGIVLTPATTIKQVLEAVSDREWGDLVKIMFLGNKNSGKVEGIVRQAMIGGTVFYADNKAQGIIGKDSFFNPLKDIDIDEDKSAGDEFMDYALYTFGGAFYTIIGKSFGLID